MHPLFNKYMMEFEVRSNFVTHKKVCMYTCIIYLFLQKISSLPLNDANKPQSNLFLILKMQGDQIFMWERKKIKNVWICNEEGECSNFKYITNTVKTKNWFMTYCTFSYMLTFVCVLLKNVVTD